MTDIGLESCLLSRSVLNFVSKCQIFIQSQLKDKIIPAFEHAHLPGFKALFLIDNSQGHSAYAANSLLVSQMNMQLGGQQAKMRNGWFMNSEERIPQKMCFPADHPQFPNQLKGMQQVLKECGLWQSGLIMKCES